MRVYKVFQKKNKKSTARKHEISLRGLSLQNRLNLFNLQEVWSALLLRLKP